VIGFLYICKKGFFIDLLLQPFREDTDKTTLKLKTENEDTSKVVSWFSDNCEIVNNET
jgi:hypothetical protein